MKLAAKSRSLLPLTLACVVALSDAVVGAEPTKPRAGAIEAVDEVTDFALLDLTGRHHQLRRQTDVKAVVLMIGGNGCPIVRQNVHKFQALRNRFGKRGARFWMLNANPQDDLASLRAEASELGLRVPILKDETQLVAYSLGVRRTAEVIAINTADWTIFYRGAIDDQLVEGAAKPAPTEHYLEKALTAFLAGQPVPHPRTRAAGCLVHYEAPLGKEAPDLSYARDVAPVLASKCAGCHSPGNIGPFDLRKHADVKGHSDTIREVLLNGQMPPWHADPRFGRFVDDRSLTAAERRTLVRWIDSGSPRGEGEDPLESAARTVRSNQEWVLGQPDFVVAPSQTITVPATGTVEYITNVVESPILKDAWLRAAVIRPDNLKVLHHAIVYVEYPPGHPKHGAGDHWLTGWAPGYRMTAFPEGTGKFLPKGTKLRWQLHYTSMGSEQRDRTELGLYLLDAKPEREIEVVPVLNTRFVIPPGAPAGSPEANVVAIREFTRDTLVYELNPHMHKRGAWFRFEAIHPDGRLETLLFVPKYDFNWQTGYVLAEPKLLPAGTRILCTGGFDNSRRNPANPDPKSEVRWGEQSWEEMFIGFMTVADAPTQSRHDVGARPAATGDRPIARN